jgi:hypothetical protein
VGPASDVVPQVLRITESAQLLAVTRLDGPENPRHLPTDLCRSDHPGEAPRVSHAVVPVVWTGSGKNKLRLVAG